jgi:hypothetical protein
MIEITTNNSIKVNPRLGRVMLENKGKAPKFWKPKNTLGSISKLVCYCKLNFWAAEKFNLEGHNSC